MTFIYILVSEKLKLTMHYVNHKKQKGLSKNLKKLMQDISEVHRILGWFMIYDYYTKLNFT